MYLASSTCQILASSTECQYFQHDPLLLSTPSISIIFAVIAGMISFAVIQYVFVK